MNNVKIQEQMEIWITYFDETLKEYRKIHITEITEKTGEDGYDKEIKQEGGTGKS